MAKQLTKDAIKKIGSSPDLFREICKRLEVKPTSLPMILKRNGDNLNRYDIVELVASYMGIDASEAVEEVEVAA